MKPAMHRRRSMKGGRSAGFTLLAILLVVVALTLLVGIALYRGLDERRSTSMVRHDVTALTVAEIGLERTRAYLANMLLRAPDLDRALDPHLDTRCNNAATTTGLSDDNLPPFTGPDVSVVTVQPAGKRFLKVPVDLDGQAGYEGAYLVRIDDNDDDEENLSAFSNTTSNNTGAFNCAEGPHSLTGVLNVLGTKHNPSRDRDRTVIITVIGITPSWDENKAQARKVLRVRVGPKTTMGIIAGGNINVTGNGAVCGEFGNVSTPGNITDGCICGDGPGSSGCCPTGNNCIVETGGTCSADFGSSTGVCVEGASVPPPPKVHVWSALNAPGPCSGTTCTPFYYLRPSANGTDVEVHMWDYSLANCNNPQACGRLYPPGETSTTAVAPCSNACWKKVYATGTTQVCSNSTTGVVTGSDDLGLGTLVAASPSWNCGLTPAAIWQLNAASPASQSPASNCDRGDGLYPDGDTSSLLGKRSAILTKFSYATAGSTIPRGVWLVEGQTHFTATTPGAPTHPSINTCLLMPPPVTLLSVGSIHVQSAVAMVPAHPQGLVMVTGRDFLLDQGGSRVVTCGKSAAILAHEEFAMGANTTVQAQIIAEDKGDCSALINSPQAITLTGDTTIEVSQAPPIAAGPQVEILDWSESSY